MPTQTILASDHQCLYAAKTLPPARVLAYGRRWSNRAPKLPETAEQRWLPQSAHFLVPPPIPAEFRTIRT